MISRWKFIKRKDLLNHPRLRIVEDDVVLPDNTQTSYIRFLDARNAVIIIALKDNLVLIQREYSYPPDMVMYQFPGGGIERDEQEDAALRELAEESAIREFPYTWVTFSLTTDEAMLKCMSF